MLLRKAKKKSIKWWLTASLYLVLFGAIGTFAYMKMDFLIRGVNIIVKVDKTSTSPLVTIKGQAQNAVYLSLNGREIYIDRDGSFNEQVALLPGLSVMTITAQDKFGKNTDKNIEVMYQESTGAVAVGDTIINTN